MEGTRPCAPLYLFIHLDVASCNPRKRAGTLALQERSLYFGDRQISVQNESMIRLHLAIFLFGLAGLFGKSLLIPATSIVFGRAALAAIALVFPVFARRYLSRDQLWKSGLKLFPSGALLAVHWVSFFYAVQVSSVATGLIAVATFPIFVILLDPFVSGTRLLLRDIICALLVCGGLILVVPFSGEHQSVVSGLLWGLVSALTFALLTLFNRRSVHSVDAATVGFFQNLWAAACLSPFAAGLLELDLSGWMQMVFLAVFCTALSHTLFISALREVRTQIASLSAGLEPVYGIFLAAVFLGEYPGWRELAGGTLILATVIYASMGASERCIH